MVTKKLNRFVKFFSGDAKAKFIEIRFSSKTRATLVTCNCNFLIFCKSVEKFKITV